MKEAVQEREVFKEKVPEIFVNSKNAMTVLDIDELKRHTGGAGHRIFVAARRAKTAVTAERNEFKVPTIRTMVHGAAKRGITAA